jgi:dTDP-glucose pyrophosphorylase
MRREDSSATLSEDQAKVAESGVKGLIPVGRPFLDFLLSALADAGFTDVCLVIGPEHEAIRAYCRKLNLQRIRIHLAVQREARGTADAVAAAEGFTGQDEFLVVNSDNYYPPETLRAAREMDGPGLVAFSFRALVEAGAIPPDRVATFPAVRTDGAGMLQDLTSKKAKAGDYISMNCWRFGPSIFPASRSILPSERGELELPDAVRQSMKAGQRYRVIRCERGVLDISSRADVAGVAEKLLSVTVRL